MHTAASEAPLHACTVMSSQSVEINHRLTYVAYTLTIYTDTLGLLLRLAARKHTHMC